MSTSNRDDWFKVENYRGFEIYLATNEPMDKDAQEGAESMGLPVSEKMREMTYRGRIIHSRHRAKYNFPTGTGDKQTALEICREHADLVHGDEPKFNLKDKVRCKRGVGRIVDISYYNRPFSKELRASPADQGYTADQYETKFSYEVKIEKLAPGEREPMGDTVTQLEYHLEKIRE